MLTSVIKTTQTMAVRFKLQMHLFGMYRVVQKNEYPVSCWDNFGN